MPILYRDGTGHDLHTKDNRWYRRYDSFLVTDGSATMLDTNGKMHWVSGSGKNLITTLLTLLCLFVASERIELSHFPGVYQAACATTTFVEGLYAPAAPSP